LNILKKNLLKSLKNSQNFSFARINLKSIFYLNARFDGILIFFFVLFSNFTFEKIWFLCCPQHGILDPPLATQITIRAHLRVCFGHYRLHTFGNRNLIIPRSSGLPKKLAFKAVWWSERNSNVRCCIPLTLFGSLVP